MGFHTGPVSRSQAARAELESVAEKICTPGKGITACDESAGTPGQRFEAATLVEETSSSVVIGLDNPPVDSFLLEVARSAFLVYFQRCGLTVE